MTLQIVSNANYNSVTTTITYITNTDQDRIRISTQDATSKPDYTHDPHCGIAKVNYI